MVKKAILFLSAAAGFISAANAQSCGTDEVHRDMIKANPLVGEIQRAMDIKWRGALNKTTGVADYLHYVDSLYKDEIKTKLIVPVVVHVVHDYASTNYVHDTMIYRMIRDLNNVYSAKNPDLVDVIAPFKKYIGDAQIEFRLARKDPNSQPTSGITHHQSPLTNGGDDQAKFDQWAPDRYLNIWTIDKIGRGVTNGEVLAYATLPAGAAQFVYSDGIISKAGAINDLTKTISHEIGHYLNLYHVWNSNQQPVASAVCGDDEVDDTPPTNGHFSTCPLYDSHCDTGYKKAYNFVFNGVPEIDTVDYPDTANVQNLMDYSSCTNMFTIQQVLRMRDALKSPVANRSSLISPVAHTATGVLNPIQDLAPIADFSVEKPSTTAQDRGFYMCAGAPRDFAFRNQSWRDTITAVEWSFTNGGAITSSGNQISGTTTVKFTEPGWATVTLTASGNNNSNTGTVSKKVYVADQTAINPLNGNMQEFNDETEASKWPAFNYYNNQSGWEVIKNVGFYDNYSIRYSGYDPRMYPGILVGSFKGDFDDFFTPAFDLSGMKGGPNCNINFMSAGVFRTNNNDLMNDKLEIAYSIDCGNTWTTIDSLKKGRLANKGTYSGQFSPLWTGDWALQSINIPDVARTSRVFFRFRYRPSVDESNTGNHRASGNNFYIDRINVSNFPLGVNTLVSNENNIVVAPNPTNGSSYVVIAGSQSRTAAVSVTDITGKVVYTTQQNLNDNINRIEIPASAISVKGIYMVHVVAGSQTTTQKLVVY
jgi:hypothetical protein